MLACTVGWSGGWIVFLLMVLVLQLYSLESVTASEEVRECFDGNDEDKSGHVEFECEKDYVIKIEDALLGRNKWGDCVIVAGDCMEKTRIFANCDGKRMCTRSFKTYSARCGYVTVALIRYSCQLSQEARMWSSTTSTSISTTISSAEVNSTVTSVDVLNIEQIRPKQPDQYNVAQNLRKNADSNADDFKETAIIVGCIIASLVTVIALVVAIILVVRRLMQKKDGITDASTPQKDPDCTETTCINLDVPCFKPGPSDHHPGEREIKSAKRTINKTPSFRTLTGKTKTRMAPVGEESSADQPPSPSEINPPSTPKSPTSSRTVLKNETELISETDKAPVEFQNTKLRRSRKRDAKNNNVEQKCNENVKKSSKQKKQLKKKDNSKNLSKNCELVYPQVTTKTDLGLNLNSTVSSD
ncbi:hypothetical protein Btru_029455 [Bulinus truncatus]|nr:hypothetical protein Btru_029455 [Bulinus truncatus]